MFAAHPHTAGQEVVAGSFGDEGRVAGHHHGAVAVAVVGGDVAGVSLHVVRHLLHKLEHLPRNKKIIDSHHNDEIGFSAQC